MRKLLLVLSVTVSLHAQTVTLLHLSDYHSHALPFYTDEGERGGIARAIAYLRAQKRAGALAFSGGDTVNKGAPAWSDKFTCAEWPWFNSVLDAMAFGNHDADYGKAEFERCRDSVTYPILSANTSGFKGTAVFTTRGVRVGVFSVAGADFTKLVKEPGFTFSDPTAAAREAVRVLRDVENAQVVVMIGHQDVDDDYAMAKAVPGIDVIFGSHSHLKRDLTQIPGTTTTYISPSQYLSYISRIEVDVKDGRVSAVRGGLVPIDDRLREDRGIARRVARMQRALEQDPKYKELFTVIGQLGAPISTESLGRRSLDVMREVTKSDVALSTKSSFRSPLPKGPLTMEKMLAAMPYDNEIVTCTMSGATLQTFLDAAGEESFVSGPASIDAAGSYRVATTDYVAFVAFKDAFACEKAKSGMHVREELKKALVR